MEDSNKYFDGLPKEIIDELNKQGTLYFLFNEFEVMKMAKTHFEYVVFRDWLNGKQQRPEYYISLGATTDDIYNGNSLILDLVSRGCG